MHLGVRYRRYKSILHGRFGIESHLGFYRWRGGDVEEFMNILNNVSPFFFEKNIINLNTNYRSSREIVDFNNSLFKSIELSKKDTIWTISGNDTLVIKQRSINNLFDKVF